MLCAAVAACRLGMRSPLLGHDNVAHLSAVAVTDVSAVVCGRIGLPPSAALSSVHTTRWGYVNVSHQRWPGVGEDHSTGRLLSTPEVGRRIRSASSGRR